MSDRLARLMLRLFLLAGTSALVALGLGSVTADWDQLDAVALTSVISLVITEIIISHWDASKAFGVKQTDQKPLKVRDWRALLSFSSICLGAFAHYKYDSYEHHRLFQPKTLCGKVTMEDGSVAYFDGDCSPIITRTELVYQWLSAGCFALTIVLLLWIYLRPLK